MTRLALSNPVAVAVAVLLALLFAVISLNRLPVQLTPEVQTPEMTVSTAWRAASPEEVEAEILEPQEQAMRGLPGMTRIASTASRGEGKLTLTFQVGFDLRRALVEVMNRLNQVSSYPTEADEPVISAVGGDSRAIAWFIIKKTAANTDPRPIAAYQDFVEDVVQSRFERVPGVALSEVRGGRGQEIRITYDPLKAAAYGIDLPRAARILGGADTLTAGFKDIGKRRYTVRFMGAYSAADMAGMVLAWHEGKPVYLRDVATVDSTLVDRSSFVMQNGEVAIAVNAHRESGVNVLRVMQGLRQAAVELQPVLARQGLSIEQVFDETTYIDRAIDMVVNNLLLGVVLAVLVLWWFLRKLRATLFVALAIPICVVSAFILMDATGRTLNVISLAGLAFAVGMVLDAAIVVLENIVRYREQGMDADQAALKGTEQVWGALLASTATTVAIFLPLVFLREEAGQLFADLALTITAAILLSLLVAITVLPTLAAHGLRSVTMHDPHQRFWARCSAGLCALTATPTRRVFWIAVLLLGPLFFSWKFMPKLDYLPQGNRNLVFAFILPPPGSNMVTMQKEMGEAIARRMQPYLDGTAQPKLKQYFFVAFNRGAFLGAVAEDPNRVGEMVGVVNRAIGDFPDTLAFAKRSSLFGSFGGGRAVDVDLQQKDMDALMQGGQIGFGLLRQSMQGASVRPKPGLDLAEPELRLIPREERLAEVGFSRSDIGLLSRSLVSGLWVGDLFDGERRLDVVLRAAPWRTPEELGELMIQTPLAGLQALNELVRIERTAGPQQIRRINRKRTLTLQVTPPDNLDLQSALEQIEQQIGPKILATMPTDSTLHTSGTADKLKAAIREMGGSFVLAVLILYLLMSALFRSFLDSLWVMITLPLATVGGVVALLLLKQSMDLLTMIGFVILLGLVVNNAILLVHQTRAAERAGSSRAVAVAEAVRHRLRPILMTTLTSIFGMLPLLLLHGAGSELYRGMAAVIVGGMLVSTLFTLILLPAVLQLGRGPVPPVSS